MIKLAIVGYGKMGKEIESVLDSNTFQLVGKYDIDNKVQENLKEIPDVAIEFSTPSSIISNVEFLASQKINIVCGTTGWYDKTEKVKEIINRNNSGFIYASNFSVGVNIYFEIVKHTAEIINKFDQYDINVEETHHTQKLDKPSGTAIRIAEYLIEKIKRKDAIVNDKNDLSNHELNIVSKRIEDAVGNHKVIFDSEADIITLEHNSKSRRGFAEGALAAAKFIHGKKGFFKFEEIFKQ
ncbi:MAG: 4-hydroxy-tetrahydrodipicolinate reductase [Ignavibacteria bacterium]